MGKVKLSKWDSAEHLKTDEDMALYLDSLSRRSWR
jgi:DNA-binding phage protein